MKVDHCFVTMAFVAAINSAVGDIDLDSRCLYRGTDLMMKNGWKTLDSDDFCHHSLVVSQYAVCL